MSYRGKNTSILVILSFAVIYLLLPTANSSGDALGYAADIRDRHNFIAHHHLFYHYFIYLSHLGIGQWLWDVLAWAKIVNALFATACLIVVSSLLAAVKPAKVHWPAILFLGACFGFMRFATENETYIIPLFFSLLGSKYLLVFDKSSRDEGIAKGFFFLGIAVLFHQIHVFWWLAFVIAFGFNFSKAKKPAFLSALMIGGVYFAFAYFSKTPFLRFVFSDVQNGLVDVVPGIDNLKFTGINLIRTFVQVHGYVLLMLERNPFLYNFVALAGIFVLYSIFLVIEKWGNIRRQSGLRYSKNALLMAFILQLLFAFYSVGNAEFMVLLPPLLVIYLWIAYDQRQKPWFFAGLGILIWNLAFGLLPQKFLKLENEAAALQLLKKHNGLFIAHDKVKLENYNAYYRIVPITGMEWMKSPAEIGNDSLSDKRILQSLKSGKEVITDCDAYPYPASRAGMMYSKSNNAFFKQWPMRRVDSFKNFYGKVYISEIQP